MFSWSPDPKDITPRLSDSDRHPKIKMAAPRPEVVIITWWRQYDVDKQDKEISNEFNMI